ncbi:MotA/TolQ/ExbB proton channel family protein [Methylicorpusculum oleiharenae]|uniref:motility protein A n=1 Tax=Methylicorpusculum oleiharenae TaxID=1338687 RepID=UPI00135A2B84|nr:MotA/TolQ/ExbB proton channel family protein [Methylicorpusculum oleiharenae]MCD2452968.1 MotA/TolQ/ExbB proton channel family protein [Methylicorpusculum oleiharenae]
MNKFDLFNYTAYKTRSLNYSTALGLIFSLLLFLFIVFVAANDARSYLNLYGLFIVVIGTIAAVCLSYPLRDIKQGIKSVKLIFLYESLNPEKEAEEIISVSKMWFNRNFVAIENVIDTINNPYLKTGFQLVVDQTPTEDILSLLKWRIARLRAQEKADANIFHSMAGFSPAFGMLGTLVGLINMLEIIDLRDVGAMSLNMGVALITTFYGLIFANLIFTPIALKLERRTEQRIMIMSMIMEGITLIAERRSPSFVRETLRSFIVRYENELNNGSN